MTEKQVDYVLEVVPDIPERNTPRSPLETTLERIEADYRKMEANGEAKQITAIVALYEKPTAGAAAANVLRMRHGSQDVEGWRFETRKVDRDGKEYHALYVNYDPTKCVPGGREAWDRKMAERKVRLAREKAAKDAAEKATEAGTTTPPAPTATASATNATMAKPNNSNAGAESKPAANAQPKAPAQK